jgi:hypothetical protein
MRDGLFPSVVATETEKIEIEGQTLNRSKGWETAFWGNSDRNPVNRPPGEDGTPDVSIAPYREAAPRAMEALTTQIVPVGRWEDFETYWSCSS